jgi:hypothetical protein
VGDPAKASRYAAPKAPEPDSTALAGAGAWASEGVASFCGEVVIGLLVETCAAVGAALPVEFGAED